MLIPGNNLKYTQLNMSTDELLSDQVVKAHECVDSAKMDLGR